MRRCAGGVAAVTAAAAAAGEVFAGARPSFHFDTSAVCPCGLTGRLLAASCHGFRRQAAVQRAPSSEPRHLSHRAHLQPQLSSKATLTEAGHGSGADKVQNTVYGLAGCSLVLFLCRRRTACRSADSALATSRTPAVKRRLRLTCRYRRCVQGRHSV
jgi:hypothetical protein